MTVDRPDNLDYEQLRRAFDVLDRPSPGEERLAYSTRVLLNNGVRIGKSRHGTPALLLPADEQRASAVTRHFANLRVAGRMGLRIDEGVLEEPPSYFIVAECVSTDESIIDWFFRLLPPMYALAESASDPVGVLGTEFERVAELLRTIDSGSKREIAGLWCELALIASAEDAVAAARAWHAVPESVHDFTRHGHHIEVKCTSGNTRSHIFSSGQLQPADQVLIASFRVEQSDGPSVLDLHDRVVARLDDVALKRKVQSLVLSAVGRRLAEADDLRFDEALVLGSLKLYRAGGIPQIPEPVPIGVSNVHFTSDLSSVSSMPVADSPPALRPILPI